MSVIITGETNITEILIDFCTYLEKEGGNEFIKKDELVDNYLESIIPKKE